MECQFEGAFSEAERRRIRSSLEALSDAARSVGMVAEPTWRVRHAEEEEGAVEFRAVHVRSGITLWGGSVDDLVNVIDETTAYLRAAG